jgi:plastocyanin
MRRGRFHLMIALVLAAMAVPSHAATIQIVMQNLEILPAEVSAKVGDTIEWVNKDGLARTATANNNDWDVMIGPNKSARLVLKKPGEVDYYCKFHPNMKGRLTVAN